LLFSTMFVPHFRLSRFRPPWSLDRSHSLAGWLISLQGSK
jgi:hypothetical protein